MQISTKSRYGLRAMVELALNSGEDPLSLREIAENQEISRKYLEQIVPHLKTAGLIRSVRGAGGGYRLTRDPEEITSLEILRSLEGPLVPVDCVDSPNICDRSNTCATRELWAGVGDSIKEYLGSRTLDELARKQEKVS